MKVFKKQLRLTRRINKTNRNGCKQKPRLSQQILVFSSGSFFVAAVFPSGAGRRTNPENDSPEDEIDAKKQQYNTELHEIPQKYMTTLRNERICVLNSPLPAEL